MKKIIIISSSIIVFLLIITAIYYEKNSSKKFQQIVKFPSLSYPIDTDSFHNRVTYKNYSGKFLNAEMPDKWEIIEYEDASGMRAGSELANYTGLTGFIVLNDTGKEIFSFKGVDGIGGTGACSEIYKFTDTNQAFIDNEIAKVKDLGGSLDQVKIVDVSNEKFSEVSIFGISVRRLGTKLYWDSEDGFLEGFNPRCGLSADVIFFKTVKYRINSQAWSYDQSGYVIRIAGDADSIDLNKLDKLLDSISLNKVNSYRNPDNAYEYNYPATWAFSREGIGLYPKNEAEYSSGQEELLTIFSVKAPGISAKDWAVGYDGSGYELEEEITINGYDVYHVVKTLGSTKDIMYTFSHNGIIVHTHFREIDNSKQISKDWSKYTKDMEFIVNSIKFLN